MNYNCIHYIFCKNNSKCFRCFNESLLKTNKKTNTKKIFSYSNEKDKLKDDSWKDLENETLRDMNNVPSIQEARKTIASGGLWFDKADINDSLLLIENKERKGTTLTGGEKSFSVKKEWLDKITNEAENANKTPCLVFRFKGDKNKYGVMDFNNLAELVNLLKTYINDNKLKEKQIKNLLNKIKTMQGD